VRADLRVNESTWAGGRFKEEGHHQVICRRTRVIRIFPHEASLLRLLTALAIEQNDRWRHHRWIVQPTYLEEEQPVRRTA